MVLSRFMNTDTHCGEYLARYAAAQVLELLPGKFPIKYLLGFIQNGFKLRQINNSELGIQKIKSETQQSVLKLEKQKLQIQSTTLNSFVMCPICNRPLLRQGKEMGQFVLLQDEKLCMVHKECF